MAHGEALRIRVIKAVVEDGLSRNEAARIFRVGIASAIRWVKAHCTVRNLCRWQFNLRWDPSQGAATRDSC